MKEVNRIPRQKDNWHYAAITYLEKRSTRIILTHPYTLFWYCSHPFLTLFLQNWGDSIYLAVVIDKNRSKREGFQHNL